jgi:hypothetical protein
LVAAYTLVVHGFMLVPMAMTVFMLYGLYYAVRSIVIACRTPMPQRPPVMQRPPAAVAPAVAETPPARPAVRLPAPPYHRRVEAERASPAPSKTFRARVEELSGSLLASTAAAAVMSIFLSLIHSKALEPGEFTWLLLVSTLGSWLVLIPSKFWEGREGDSTLRRLTLMVLGMGLGAAAWAVKDFLFVPLSRDWTLPAPVTEEYVSARFYDPDFSPSLIAHMAYFAFLMLLVRWWKQADPSRPSRLRFWPTVTAIFWAWLLYFFWPFPQPWGTMVAATMSIAVQVAATWEPTRRRWSLS